MPDTLTEQIDGLEFLGGVYADVENQFNQMDWEPQLREFVDVLAEKHAEHFSGQHDPSGRAWAPLAQSTIDRKGHDTILFETGRLRSSVVGGADHIEDVGGDFLVFGSSVEYGVFHDTGTQRMPQRQFVGMDEQTLGVLLESIADATVEGLKLTR